MKHIMGPNSRSTLSQVQPNDIQPNAVDLRIDKVLRIKDGAMFKLSEKVKEHRGSIEVSTFVMGDGEDWFNLAPGHYEVVMQNIIQVGPGEAGWVITRSTLNRNGVFITSGLYDTGYHGVMAAALHVTCGNFVVARGTRIGQYLSFNSESLKEYNGSYGLQSDHDKKYTSQIKE